MGFRLFFTEHPPLYLSDNFVQYAGGVIQHLLSVETYDPDAVAVFEILLALGIGDVGTVGLIIKLHSEINGGAIKLQRVHTHTAVMEEEQVFYLTVFQHLP